MSRIKSPHIKKTGVGLIKDIAIIWDDLRLEMRNLVDVVMMARLLLAERYPKGSYGNLALKTCAQDVLGFELSKDLSVSDWAADKLDDEQLEYAGLDAITSLRLYEVLEDALMRRRIEINQEIPDAWYKFNSRSWEPTRRKPGYEQTDIVWRFAVAQRASGEYDTTAAKKAEEAIRHHYIKVVSQIEDVAAVNDWAIHQPRENA
ncbi:ribonuclease H-like domain-containing protein [Mycena latifolia]|nr:ribonuclease H-like domain-containing protein [Mycena latifolia]